MNSSTDTNAKGPVGGGNSETKPANNNSTASSVSSRNLSAQLQEILNQKKMASKLPFLIVYLAFISLYGLCCAHIAFKVYFNLLNSKLTIVF